MAEGSQVIAVDVGGTNIRVAVVTSEGEVALRKSVPTDADEGQEAVIGRIAALMRAVATEAVPGAGAVAGVVAPGPINARTGELHLAPNLPGWRDVPLRRLLQERTGLRIRLSNDVNAAALGEWRFGAGVGASDIVYLALGTGVGGGVIAAGKLIEGADGFGGELGHVVVSLDGPRCHCGGIGCLEAYVGGWAIAREGEFVAGTADGAAIRDAAGDGPPTAQSVASAAAAGDPAALAILRRAGHALGAAIGGFINVFNPEVVAIGGGVAGLGELLLEPARQAIPSYSFRKQRERARLVWSRLGDDTALLGAAAMAFDTARHDSPMP